MDEVEASFHSTDRAERRINFLVVDNYGQLSFNQGNYQFEVWYVAVFV